MFAFVVIVSLWIPIVAIWLLTRDTLVVNSVYGYKDVGKFSLNLKTSVFSNYDRIEIHFTKNSDDYIYTDLASNFSWPIQDMGTPRKFWIRNVTLVTELNGITSEHDYTTLVEEYAGEHQDFHNVAFDFGWIFDSYSDYNSAVFVFNKGEIVVDIKSNSFTTGPCHKFQLLCRDSHEFIMM